MFSHKHYIPILKWKRAEQNALKTLSEKHKELLTPLVQFVMPRTEKEEQLEEVISRFNNQLIDIPNRVLDVWGRTPIFVDVSLLYSTGLKEKTLATIPTMGRELGCIFIPVIYLSDDIGIKKSAIRSAKLTGNGLCLRLVCSDFSDMSFINQEMINLLSSGLREESIDLLVDVKETEDRGQKANLYFNYSQSLPRLSRWRTYIFSSGAFPENLTKYKVDEENLIPRIDWQTWKACVAEKGLKRKPAFSDYTIRYAIYKEHLQFYHPTTSIKYALENEWLIMKGKVQDFSMYLANAKLLSEDIRFYGKAFSSGDEYISNKAAHYNSYIRNKKIGGTGSNETWICAGINHHLAVVESQVANLS